MIRNWMRIGTIPLLAAALWLAGCSDQSLPAGELFGPQEAQLSKGNGNAKGLDRFQKVLGTVPDDAVLVDEKVIGASGGTLSAAGYQLFVRAGAVNRPTTFRMEAMTDGSIGVKLTAVQIDRQGREKDVGAAGFRKPLTLSLYYGNAIDQITDESLLAIALVQSNGQLVVQKSFVSTEYQRVFTDLQHFSDYALVMP